MRIHTKEDGGTAGCVLSKFMDTRKLLQIKAMQMSALFC